MSRRWTAVGSQSERLGVRLEHRIEVQPRSCQGAAHLVQGLAQRTGGGDHRLRPEVGRDRLAGPRSAGQHEQREQRLRVTAHEPDLLPGRGTDREAAEERDLQAERGGGAVSHDVPSKSGHDVRPIPPEDRTSDSDRSPPKAGRSHSPHHGSGPQPTAVTGMVSAVASRRDGARDTPRVGQPTPQARVHCRDRADRRHRVRLRPALAPRRRPRRALADGRARRRGRLLSRRCGRSRPSRVVAPRRPAVHRRGGRARGRHRRATRSAADGSRGLRRRSAEPPGPRDRRVRAGACRGRWDADRGLRRKAARGARRPLGARAGISVARGAGRRQAGHGPRREWPGVAARRHLVDGLPRSRSMGFARPRASFAPGAALRGDRNACPRRCSWSLAA